MSLNSTPEGADIEIDGNFMGSTPSSIEVAPGDHVVVIKKRGFKDWERKLKLTGGEIKVAADLETEAEAGKPQ